MIKDKSGKLVSTKPLTTATKPTSSSSSHVPKALIPSPLSPTRKVATQPYSARDIHTASSNGDANDLSMSIVPRQALNLQTFDHLNVNDTKSSDATIKNGINQSSVKSQISRALEGTTAGAANKGQKQPYADGSRPNTGGTVKSSISNDFEIESDTPRGEDVDIDDRNNYIRSSNNQQMQSRGEKDYIVGTKVLQKSTSDALMTKSNYLLSSVQDTGVDKRSNKNHGHRNAKDMQILDIDSNDHDSGNNSDEEFDIERYNKRNM